jgi:hypothetical protein
LKRSAPSGKLRGSPAKSNELNDPFSEPGAPQRPRGAAAGPAVGGLNGRQPIAWLRSWIMRSHGAQFEIRGYGLLGRVLDSGLNLGIGSAAPTKCERRYETIETNVQHRSQHVGDWFDDDHERNGKFVG